jgi:uncharacterized membrane-anchored protein YhcB (DUF1043 family)
MLSDLVSFILIGAGLIVGFALGVIVEGRLSGRELASLRAQLEKTQALVSRQK